MLIQITKPFLPPLDEYNQYLKGIWTRNWLTNDGPLVLQLTNHLKDYLHCPSFVYLSNGTIAIQIAIKALDLKGEIITTPFSFVATTSSIVWENCIPVFADIDPNTFNIDPEQIESKITDKTSAILATHVFGNPCDVDKIERIAKKHHLKVIYDAAHCFGVRHQNRSVFEFGDLSTTSFHATKVFHTIEGGAVFTKDLEMMAKLVRLRNFGFSGVNEFTGVGVNAKNSEFHAAMGLAILKYIDEILARRKAQYVYYHDKLAKFSKYKFQQIAQATEYNYSYFPIVFESEALLLQIQDKLQLNRISPRRYFYPSLSTLDYVQAGVSLPVAEQIAPSVLCLPLYHDMTKDEQDYVCNIITAV